MASTRRDWIGRPLILLELRPAHADVERLRREIFETQYPLRPVAFFTGNPKRDARGKSYCPAVAARGRRSTVPRKFSDDNFNMSLRGPSNSPAASGFLLDSRRNSRVGAGTEPQPPLSCNRAFAGRHVRGEGSFRGGTNPSSLQPRYPTDGVLKDQFSHMEADRRTC